MPSDAEVLDEHAHEACYVWQPTEHESDSVDNRAAKRRKVSRKSADDDHVWPKLLNGTESHSCAQRRQAEYEKQWQQQEDLLGSLVEGVGDAEVDTICNYIGEAQSLRTDTRISTGLLPAHGADLHHDRIFRLIAEDTKLGTLAVLDATNSPNLQTALKTLIKTVIVEAEGSDAYQTFISKHKGLLPMQFDLELLQLFVVEYKVNRVILFMPQIESFDLGVLTDFLSTLSTWTDRIPFVLFLGIATTVELLEMRLPGSTVQCLDAQTFEVSARTDQAHEVLSDILQAADRQLFFGPSTLSSLLEMSHEHTNLRGGLIRIFKYIYMTHFFANPLSVLLVDFTPTAQDLPPLCEAIRNTKSFQSHCETLLLEGDASRQQVRTLLNNDEALFEAARSAVTEGQARMRRLLKTVEQFKSMYTALGLAQTQPQNSFSLDAQLVQSLKDLDNSDIYTTMISTLQKLRSDKLLTFLSTPPALQILDPTHVEALQTFQETHPNPQIHASSAASTSNLSTSISTSGSRITLTKSPSSSSKPKRAPSTSAMQQEYTTVMESLISDIESYFRTNLSPISTSTTHSSSPTTSKTSIKSNVHPFLHGFMAEAYIFNSQLPFGTSFNPRPRHAIERALTRPADYLDCGCCTSSTTHIEAEGEGMLGGVKHETSLLYGLLQEAGGIVNVRDLWDAFLTSVTSGTANLGGQDEMDREDDEDGLLEDGEGGEGVKGKERGAVRSERQALMLFYRSLAELKMLGLCKASKKRAASGNVDCIAKTSWMGL